MDWILVKTVNFVNNLKNLLYLVFKKKKKNRGVILWIEY
jgi:hypothetical protein